MDSLEHLLAEWYDNTMLHGRLRMERIKGVSPMKQRNAAGVYTVLMVLALVFLSGCGPELAGDKPAEPIYYPPAPNLPRIQFLLQITELAPSISDSDSGSGFANFIVGAKIEKKSERINTPYGVAARNGKIYVCDLAIANIHIIDIANSKYSLMGKRGVFKTPVNITIAPDGTKYVSDTGLSKVAVFDAQDRFVRFMGDPTKCMPIDVALCKGELIVADIKDNEIEAWSIDGKPLRRIASCGEGVDQLNKPTNVEVGPKDRIFVSDTLGGVIKKYNIKGQYLGSVGARGDRPGFFSRPKGLAIDSKGILYATDAQWQVIQIFDAAGRLLMVFGGAKHGPDGMGMPVSVTIDRTSLPVFEKYIAKDFRAEYLLFVANQYGLNKIGVYAFGKLKTADYPSVKPRSTTRLKAQPPATQPVEPSGTR
jgi:hypothetical protein